MTKMPGLLAKAQLQLRSLRTAFLSQREKRPLLAGAIEGALKDCRERNLDSLLLKLSRISSSFAAGKPPGFEDRGIELNLLYNELRKASPQFAVAPVKSRLQELLVVLASSLLELRAAGVAPSTIDATMDVLEKVRGKLLTEKAMLNISARDARKLVHQFLYLSEQISSLHALTARSQRTGHYREILVQAWDELVEQLFAFFEACKLRTGEKLLPSTRPNRPTELLRA